MHSNASSPDCTLPYTMKTARPAPPGPGGPHASSYRSPKSTTPLASPRMLAHSIGQPYPPRLSSPRHSPSAGAGAGAGAGACAGVQEARAASSPSYFGLVVEPSADPRESAVLPRNNWSSPSSSVRSFDTAVPKQQHIAVEANPAYDAFRRQADANHLDRSFSLGSAQFSSPRTPHASEGPSTSPRASPSASAKAKAQQALGPSTPQATPPTTGPTASNLPCESSSVPTAAASDPVLQHGYVSARPPVPSPRPNAGASAASLHDSAYVSSDSSERNSVASNPSPFFPNMPRFESPAQLDRDFELSRPPAPQLFSDEHRHPRFPMAHGRLSMTIARTNAPAAVSMPARAETAPATMSSAQGMMDVRQLKEIMDRSAAEATAGGQPTKVLLLLDVRVATYYAASRIRGALNLCIPTTLLKRATFNLQKLQLTFARDEDQATFASWRNASHIVVYDNCSAEKRDAVAAMNMLRKFTSEGYQGQASILRGGYKAFEEAYPNLIERPSTSPSSPGSLSLGRPGAPQLSIAPIIGGVAIPKAGATPNPFFANIRQNMDLADGVGRIELSLPPSVSVAVLPAWLRDAADPSDRGQKVSEKFLQLELTEQARMRSAYASFNPLASGPQAQTAGAEACVQISGVEKGSKNRYKDILPFEHARVRLQGRAAGDCDYVNASHLRASRSNKRYIASQAPLPATFADFWSMIWDEDVRVIVMLTAESEGGQLKCHPYWTNTDYGAVKVRLLSEKKVSLDVDKHRSNSAMSGSVMFARLSDDGDDGDNNAATSEFGRRRAQTLVSGCGSEGGHSSSAASLHGLPAHANGSGTGSSEAAPFVFIRKFALSHGSHPFSPIREVTQLHYPSWPDFGTPAQPSHLLALVELANVMQRAASPLGSPHGGQGLAPAAATASPFSPAQAQAQTQTANGRLDHLFWAWHDEPELSPDPKPMLVHCSAGCGRTGTFCTVDSVLDMLKRQNQRALRRANAASAARRSQAAPDGRRPSSIAPNEDVPMVDVDDAGGDAAADAGPGPADDEVDRGFDPAWLDGDAVDLVASTVADFRTQRLSMVQTLRQYVLCYETITEWLVKMQERRSGSLRAAAGRARSESVRIPTL